MSTRPVSGIVSKVDHRDFPDRNTGQPVRLFSFQLEGSNQWFRTGSKPLPAGVGQTVQFVANDQKVDVHTVSTVGAASQTTVAPPPNAPNASSARTNAPVQSAPKSAAAQTPLSKDQYWANKEARDLDKEQRFQAVNEPRMALSVGVQAAAHVVAAALASDALGFGTTAKSKRVELLGDFVEEVALRLATFIHNAPENLAQYKDSIPVEVKESSSSVDSQE